MNDLSAADDLLEGQEQERSGALRGAVLGILDGFSLGVTRGTRIGEELGYYAAVAELVAAFLSEAPRTLSESVAVVAVQPDGTASPSAELTCGAVNSPRAVRVAQEVMTAVAAFPLENDPTLDIEGELQRLRGKFKLLTVLARLSALSASGVATGDGLSASGPVVDAAAGAAALSHPGSSTLSF
jgi:hypothetical protein